MDKVVRVCTGGPVSQIGSGADFGGMEVTILLFELLDVDGLVYCLNLQPCHKELG